jgi:hypothetical protein
MGPWNEDTQLKRIDAVRRLLAQPDLNDWARAYWTSVLNRIAMTEDRYNARVVSVFKEAWQRRHKEWW